MAKNREPLSALMTAALEVAISNSGRLKRFPGGYWANDRYKWRANSRPDPHITSMTIGALVERGLMEFAGPAEVRVRP